MSAGLESLAAEAQSCTACELSATRHSVVFASGPAIARVLLVGEAPGAEEDRTGIPFVGRSGVLLGELLDEVGLERSMLYVTNVVKCRPPANRTPRAREVATCRRFLIGQLDTVCPVVVITLGNTATRAVLDTTRPISMLRGEVHHEPRSGRAVVPTYHPAAALRGGAVILDRLRSDLRLAASLSTEAP